MPYEKANQPRSSRDSIPRLNRLGFGTLVLNQKQVQYVREVKKSGSRGRDLQQRSLKCKEGSVRIKLLLPEKAKPHHARVLLRRGP
jgi:hypothetical protein